MKNCLGGTVWWHNSHQKKEGLKSDPLIWHDKLLDFRDLERVKGIEPSLSAWEAAALPLSYTRIYKGLR